LLVLLLVACSDDGIDIVTPPEDENPGGPAIVQLRPSRVVYHVGERVPIEVVIDGARDVASIVFHLRYDSQVLAFAPPAVEGPFMGSDGANTVFLSSDTGSGGEIVVALSRLGAAEGASGAGTLAVLEFDAITPGDCGFQFTDASVRDPQARYLPSAFQTVEVRVE
jgi:general secretion pathway protein D